MTIQIKQRNAQTNLGPIRDSALAKFQISFEYDRTWSEAKNTLQQPVR